jgi:3-oxoacyl-[acyl-carrier-protein] synthase II
MRKRVVITGLGCVCPVGNNVKDSWQALLACKSGAAPITSFDASAHKTTFAAEVKGFGSVYPIRYCRYIGGYCPVWFIH